MQQNTKNTVAFLSLGCKVNSYETNAMEKLFRDAGYTIVDFTEKAQIYIINTCTVTNMADRKSRQMLHKARKMNPEAIVVAVGCYVQAMQENVEKDEAVDLIVGNDKKGQIVEFVEAYRADAEHAFFCDTTAEAGYEPLLIDSPGEKTRAYVKIQDGCNQFCSYCIIPYVRGRIRSRSIEDILEEVRGLAGKGYHEVVLTGIHLSSYGVDVLEEKDFVKAEGKPLLEVIDAISELEEIKRIRLGSLEPRIIQPAFVERLHKNKKVCPHFHLSLQSGCDTVLKRMNRKYTSSEYEDKCQLLREYYEHPAITTDVIVGFPGESEEEYEQTARFLESIAFADVHIFKYSRRKGTQADRMEEQIDEPVKAARSASLIAMGEKMRQDYVRKFLGIKQSILLEESMMINGRKYMVGHNEYYCKLAVLAEENAWKANDLIDAVPQELSENGILLCENI